VHLSARQIGVAAAAVIAGFLAAFAIGSASTGDSSSTVSLPKGPTNGAVSVTNIGAAASLPSMKVKKTKKTTSTSTGTTTQATQTSTQTQTQTTQTQTPTQTQTQTTKTQTPTIEG